MRNLFLEGTYQAGVGIAMPTLGGFRPLQMGQVTNQPASGMIPNTTGTTTVKGGGAGDVKVRPGPEPVTPEKGAARPRKLDIPKNRFEWAVGRLCSIMRKLNASSANPNAISRVFWAFVRHARSSEESVLTAYKTMCPELPVPEKPKKVVQEKPAVPVRMTYKEAVAVAAQLEKALENVTVEQVVGAADAEASGTLAPEDLPNAEILKEEIVAFIQAGDTGATLTVDQAEVAAADKAIAQSSEVSGDSTKKVLLTTAAVAGVGALLYYLLKP
jgi:hypothetical protein